MRRVRGTAVWLALLLGACRGSGQFVTATTVSTPAPTTTSTSSTTTSTTTTTVVVGGARQRTVALAGSPITLRFDDALPPAVLAIVEATLPIARQDLGDSGALTVHVYESADEFVAAHEPRAQARAREDVDGGVIASTTTGNIFIYGPRFAERDPSTRRLIVLHEYFHTVQIFQSSGRSSRAPLWLREGSARYFEWRAGADHGYTDYRRRRENDIRESRDLEPLQSFETRGGPSFRGDGGEAYILGFLASEYLVVRNGADALKRDLWVELQRPGDWQQTFATVFGVSTDQFYADFEAYRLTL